MRQRARRTRPDNFFLHEFSVIVHFNEGWVIVYETTRVPWRALLNIFDALRREDLDPELHCNLPSIALLL